MPELPDSARFALWFNAWRTGRASLDDVRDEIVGSDAAHDIRMFEPQAEPLIMSLRALQPFGPAGLALPVPGDPLGLCGPPTFNAEALEHGEAVVFDGLALVPFRAGSGVTWVAHRTQPGPPLPDLAETDTALRQALLEAADTLAELDVARWNPEAAEALMDLRTGSDFAALPPGTSARTTRMLEQGQRCRAIVSLAFAGVGGALTAGQEEARRLALEPLERAARRALVAAVSYAGAR